MKKLMYFVLFLVLGILSGCEVAATVTLDLFNNSISSAEFTVYTSEGEDSYNVSSLASLMVEVSVDDPSYIPVSVNVGGQTITEFYDGTEGMASVILTKDSYTGEFLLKGDLKSSASSPADDPVDVPNTPSTPSTPSTPNTPASSSSLLSLLTMCDSGCPEYDFFDERQPCAMACGVISMGCDCLDDSYDSAGQAACLSSIATVAAGTLPDICEGAPAGCQYCML